MDVAIVNVSHGPGGGVVSQDSPPEVTGRSDSPVAIAFQCVIVCVCKNNNVHLNVCLYRNIILREKNPMLMVTTLRCQKNLN